MVLKIKKRDFIFLSTSLLVAIPLIIAGLMISIPTVLGAVNRSFFIVELTISGRAPTIFYVNFTQAGDLVDGGLAYIDFIFNVSDLDGYDLDSSKTMVNLTLGGNGGQSVFNSTNCTINTHDENYTEYTCKVIFNYYNNESSNWVVNVSVTDSAGISAFNDTLRFTVNELTAMRLEGKASVNFTTGIYAGAKDVGAATNPFVINNTGNFDFSNGINITGQNLTGVNQEVITPGNISVSVTDAVGTSMLDNTPVIIPNANLTHGAPGIGNISFYFYTDVPAGLSAQIFNVSAQWEITLE